MMARLLVSACFACGAAAACGSGAEGPVATDEQRNMSADQVILDGTHYMTVDGLRHGILTFDTAYVYDDSAHMSLRTLHGRFFDDTGAESGELTAERGELNIRTEAMTARGNVVLTTRVGSRRVETAELHFDPQQDRIWSDSVTTLREDGTTIRGRRFTSDSRFYQTRILEPIGRVEGMRIQF